MRIPCIHFFESSSIQTEKVGKKKKERQRDKNERYIDLEREGGI
jgi:hypothetical protein